MTARARILVVEDDPLVRTVIGRILSKGFDVTLTATAAAAEAAWEEQPFDLLLTDVVMAPVDGCALARSLRRRSPGLRVLFMSGYPAEALARYGPIRADEFVAKPMSPAALREHISRALAERPA